jgi:hypothetical protein
MGVVLLCVRRDAIVGSPFICGSLFACVGATLSTNQHVLVINDLTLDDPDETHIRKVTGSTFHIVQQSQ